MRRRVVAGASLLLVLVAAVAFTAYRLQARSRAAGDVLPHPSPSVSATAMRGDTLSPTGTPTKQVLASPTISSTTTPRPSGRPSATPTATITASPTDAPSATPTATATPTSSPIPQPTATATELPATPSPSSTPTMTPVPPSNTPTTGPTATPEVTATATAAPIVTSTVTATTTVPLSPTMTVTATVLPGTPVTAPLVLGPAGFSLFTVNPLFTRQTVWFSLSAPARVQVRIAPTGLTTNVRTIDMGRQPAGTIQLSWDGRDNAQQLVPAGSYQYTITATGADHVPHSESYSMLGITYKRIYVSLSQQRLTAYDGKTPFLTTLVTTGNPALPTPVGDFPILAKYSPFTFRSPWPMGSQYYYAPSTANYALLFDNRGYYVHDAPWRTAYGPGTNTQLGTPGQNYTGTHGCVNVPLAAEEQLFAWATIGTIVQVVP